MKKILILTDFSEAASNALAFASSFFGDAVADFHLLCVHPAESEGFYSLLYGIESSQKDYPRQLNEILVTLQQESTTDWHTFRAAVCPGDWLDVVEKSLILEPYDFIVIGSQMNGELTFFGTRAETRIRQLKANMLVVPVDAITGTLRRVVLAADFAKLDVKLLNPLKELVALKGASLTLLAIETPDQAVIHLEKEVNIRRFLAPIEPTVARLTAINVKEGINTFLLDHSTDLLVTIPHHKGWAGNLTGSSETNAQIYPLPIPLLRLYDERSDHVLQPVDEVVSAVQVQV